MLEFILTYYMYRGREEKNKRLFFFFKSLIIKPTTLNTNEQEAIGDIVVDPVACVVSMPPKYQHVVSSLGNEE